MFSWSFSNGVSDAVRICSRGQTKCSISHPILSISNVFLDLFKWCIRRCAYFSLGQTKFLLFHQFLSISNVFLELFKLCIRRCADLLSRSNLMFTIPSNFEYFKCIFGAFQMVHPTLFIFALSVKLNF